MARICRDAPKLGQLTKQILRHVPELKRLRISSIDQVEVDRDLLDVIADEERLMPHLHLSLQSGDDLILKRMKRRHSARTRRSILRRGAAAAAGHHARRRHHRGLSDRDGRYVHAFAGSRRGMRSDVPACVSLFAAPGHAGVADAAGRGRTSSGARASACAPRAKRRCSGGSLRRSAPQGEVLIESATQGRTEHFLPVAISGEMPGAVRRLDNHRP